METTNCPVCGSKVKVSIGEEGTGCYLPVDVNEKMVEALNIIATTIIGPEVWQAELAKKALQSIRKDGK